MCTTTAAASDATDRQTDNALRGLNRTLIISMDRETARVSTGTSELVELEMKDQIIINFLR